MKIKRDRGAGAAKPPINQRELNRESESRIQGIALCDRGTSLGYGRYTYMYTGLVTLRGINSRIVTRARNFANPHGGWRGRYLRHDGAQRRSPGPKIACATVPI